MRLKLTLGMKGHRQDYFVLGMGLVLLLIVITIAYITFSASIPEPEETAQILPTPTPSRQIKNVMYDMKAQAKLLDKVTNRQVLAENDQLAKAKILALLPAREESGVLYQSKTIIIDYTQLIDLFMVEIFTTDIAAAKAEANVWFRNQGMSQRGICNLPVVFFLNTTVVERMQHSTTEFSPIAASC